MNQLSAFFAVESLVWCHANDKLEIVIIGKLYKGKYDSELIPWSNTQAHKYLDSSFKLTI